MSNMLTEKHFLTEVITIPFKNQQFDFQVTVSVFGEVIHVNNLLLELPPMARKLMYGQQEDNALTLSNALGKVLFYEVPMVFRKLVSISYLKTCIKNIRAARKVLITKQDLPTAPIYQQKWITTLDAVLKSNHPSYETGIACLCSLVKKRKFKYAAPLEALEKSKFWLVEPVIATIIPLQTTDNHRAELYRSLSIFPKEAHLDLLLKSWDKEDTPLVKSSILWGLMPYKNSAVCRMGLHFYDTSKTRLRGKTLEYFLVAMQVYRHHRFWEINIDILRKWDEVASPRAAKLMLEAGYAEKNLVRLLPNYFDTSLPISKLVVSLSIFKQIKKTSNLPTTLSLIDLFVKKVNKHTQAARLISQIAYLLARSYRPKTSILLTQQIQSDNIYVSNNFIKLTQHLYESYPNINFQIPTDLVHLLKEISSAIPVYRARNSLSLLACLAKKHAKPDWMDFFTTKKEQNVRETLPFAYQGIINTWLKHKEHSTEKQNHVLLDQFVQAYSHSQDSDLQEALTNGIQQFSYKQVEAAFSTHKTTMPMPIVDFYRFPVDESKRNQEISAIIHKARIEREKILGDTPPLQRLLLKAKSLWDV